MFEKVKLNIKNTKDRRHINQSLKILQLQQKDVSNLKIKLTKRLNKIKILCNDSLSNNNHTFYAIYKKEYEDIDKLFENIKISEISIIRAISRMETLRDVHQATNSLGLAVKMCKDMDVTLSTILPDVNEQILTLNKSLNQSLDLPELSNNELFELNKSIESNILEPIAERIGNETDKFESIVKNNQITSIGNKKMIDNSGNTTMNFKKFTPKESKKNIIEEKISKYIDNKEGHFDVVDAANELGLSVETVETKTLELMNRGKIKIRR